MIEEIRIKEAIADIMSKNDLNKYTEDMKDPDFFTTFQFYYWLNDHYRKLLEDCVKGDEDAGRVIEIAFNAWLAHRSWVEYQNEKKSMKIFEFQGKEAQEIIERLESLQDRSKNLRKIEDKLKLMGLPDDLIKETAIEFYKSLTKQ